MELGGTAGNLLVLGSRCLVSICSFVLAEVGNMSWKPRSLLSSSNSMPIFFILTNLVSSLCRVCIGTIHICIACKSTASFCGISAALPREHRETAICGTSSHLIEPFLPVRDYDIVPEISLPSTNPLSLPPLTRKSNIASKKQFQKRARLDSIVKRVEGSK